MARVEEHWTPTVLHLMAAEVQYAFRCCMHVTNTEKAQRTKWGIVHPLEYHVMTEIDDGGPLHLRFGLPPSVTVYGGTSLLTSVKAFSIAG